MTGIFHAYPMKIRVLYLIFIFGLLSCLTAQKPVSLPGYQYPVLTVLNTDIYEYPIIDFRFSPDDTYFTRVNIKGDVEVVTIPELEKYMVMEGYSIKSGESFYGVREWPFKLAYSPDSSRLVRYSSDQKALTLWDFNSKNKILSLPAYDHDVLNVALNSNKMIFSYFFEDVVKTRIIDDETEEKKYAFSEASIKTTTISPLAIHHELDFAAAALSTDEEGDTTIALFAIKENIELLQTRTVDKKVEDLVFAEEDDCLYALGEDGEVRKWSTVAPYESKIICTVPEGYNLFKSRIYKNRKGCQVVYSNNERFISKNIETGKEEFYIIPAFKSLKIISSTLKYAFFSDSDTARWQLHSLEFYKQKIKK
ncbi:MAG: hypothetical protein GY754_36560 [bacterium]|nr:hypothetical protein [bacterium]